MYERLRQVPLFAGLSDEDLAHVCADVAEVRLDLGDHLFREGDPGDAAFVVIQGELEVVKTAVGRETVVALRSGGDVIGEGALLRDTPRTASVRARGDATLLLIPRQGVDHLLRTSPDAARRLFLTLLDRVEETAVQLRHNERMAQLGTMTAGIAHELDNPAAAVARAAETLRRTLGELFDGLDGVEDVATVVEVARGLVPRRAEDASALPASVTGRGLTMSDEAETLGAWLRDRGVDDPWRLGHALVRAGGSREEVVTRAEGLSSRQLGAAVRWAVAVASSEQLADTIAEGAGRLSGIVASLRSFVHLDRAPVDDLDVHRGLDDTVVLLEHRLGEIEVRREYDPDLPTITAMGGELNQVWTNLIGNAIDALRDGETPSPRITLRTCRSGGDVVVEVEDNGPGVPPDVRDRIFDAFFTTKPPGAGTGLGLQLSHRIVALEHRGNLTFASEPGRTVFRVTLPVTGTDPPPRG